MAVAWGGPAALLTGGGALALAPSWALPLATLSLLLAFTLFFVYDRLPAPRRAVFLMGALTASPLAAAAAGGSTTAFVGMALAALILAFVLTIDYAGSTPIEGGSHFDERRFDIRLDRERCKGVYSCWEVCPEACFEKPEPTARVELELATAERRGREPITLAHEDRCVRCGACIVQCPLDALAFETSDGERIEPETIRRYKLNLLGSRGLETRAD